MLTEDLRHACRSLLRRRGFTGVAVLTLALGLGATTVIFSWVDGLLLNALPGVRDPHSIAAVRFTTATRNNLSFSYPNYVDIRDAQLDGISDVSVFATGPLTLRTSEGTDRIWGQIISGNLLGMLGVEPAAGRLLTPADDRTPDGHPVVVLSHAFWQRRFGGRTGIVGQPVTINGRTFDVIGVTAAGFIGAIPLVGIDVFVPLAMQKAFMPGDRLADRGSGWLQGLVRLQSGATLAQAQASADVMAARLARDYPGVNEGRGLRLFDLWRTPDGGTSMLLPVMAVLSGVVGTLLLLVCSNLAGLLLAKASGRQRELALRRAVGASRAQLIRLLLAESLMLSIAGGLLAVPVALWSGDLLRAFLPPLPLPVVINTGLNWQVLAFATAVSVGTGILFGALPALAASRTDSVAVFKDGAPMGGATTWRRGWLRQGLVVLQVALALVLLVSAGLFVRTLQAAQSLDAGFQTRTGFVASVDLQPGGHDEPTGRLLFRRLVDEVGRVPGVESAAIGQRLPLTMTDSSDRSVDVDGYTPGPTEEMTVYYQSVGVGYFETLALPVLRGRTFTPADSSDTPPVVVVNETMASRYWPGGNAIGGRVRVGDRWAEVVGIARDTKYSSITEEPRAFMYLSIEQFYRPTMRLIVRTRGDAAQAVGAVRQAVLSVDPHLPLFDVQTLSEHLAFSLFVFELAATLLGLFGGAALLLATLGLYGVIAYSWAQRTRELGVRVSLGATGGDILGLVLRQGGALAAAGVGLGVIVSLAVTRLFASQLVGVEAFDLPTYAVTLGVLTATTMGACYLPARRAARLDPISALRVD